MSLLRVLTATVCAGIAAAFGGVTAAAMAETAAAATHPQIVTLTIRNGDRIAAPNIALAPGVPVHLTVVNHTHEFHTFTVAGLDVSALVGPAMGQVPRRMLVTFTPRHSGVFTWRCVICPSGAHGLRHTMSGAVYVIVDPSALP